MKKQKLIITKGLLGLGLYCFGVYTSICAQDSLHVPSISEVISLKGAGNPQMSPDGKHVAFTRTRTDWKENRYDTEIWLSREGSEPFQLTQNTEGSSSNPTWSPDSKWIAFRSKRGDRSQIHVISKPKERLAASWHNYMWFGKYVWGEEWEAPFLSVEEKKSE